MIKAEEPRSITFLQIAFMPSPGAKPATSGFVRCRPPSLKPRVALLHKAPCGNVGLEFHDKATEVQRFQRANQESLPGGVAVRAAG
jgi:hypothetical protein